ncbi:MAG: hypothetical protein LQ344_007080 [Seirophora lacunosa]|nr:MAG: hypothetical protein LQ344_007080 [Seirophora lacunosa]
MASSDHVGRGTNCTLSTYSPLRSKDSIRLLRLESRNSNPNGRARGELIEVQLSVEPEYEAISYTWGKPPFTGILVTSFGSIRIPENLEDALHYLALDNEPRYLWADAVCIDQADVPEKSSQVAIMGDIFHLARRVLVWLGLGDERTAHVFDLLGILSSRAEDYGVDAALVDTKEQPWATTRADEKQDLLLENVPSDYDLTGMDEFYSSPWFRRLWVVQEIALARDIQVHCGTQEISWKKFLTAATIKIKAAIRLTYDWLPCSFLAAVAIISARSRFQQARSASLLNHMILLSEQDCSLDVDRVYAVLNLRGPRDPQICPDYDKSVQKMYTSTTEALMLTDINVLAYAGISRRLGKLLNDQKQCFDTDNVNTLERLCAELPSWVADWRVSSISHPPILMAYPAATAARGHTQVARHDPGLLEIIHPSPVDIRGLVVDTVDSEMGFGSVDIMDLEQFRARLLEIEEFYNSKEDRIITYGEDDVADFARTIIVDLLLAGSVSFSHTGIAWSKQDLVNLWQHFGSNPHEALDQVNQGFEHDECSKPRSALSGRVLYDPRELAVYRLALRAAVRNRTFFVTKKGWVGLAPAMVRSGDVVVLIAGMSVPMILRRTRQTTSAVVTYYLVGDCYVYGIMQGEFRRDMDPEALKDSWRTFSLR